SSRRPHADFDCDWASDVFSPDLSLSPAASLPLANNASLPEGLPPAKGWNDTLYPSCGIGARFHEPWNAMNAPPRYFAGNCVPVRSEERRVGEEWVAIS